MYAGAYHDFLWEIEAGDLIISSANPKVGELLRTPLNNRFNNAEQATWFAQGRIDTQLETLTALALEHSPRR